MSVQEAREQLGFQAYYGPTTLRDSSVLVQGDVLGPLTINTNANATLHQRILQSLWYNEMNARLNEIKDSHHDTFKWVFGESEQRREDTISTNLRSWLSDSSTLYFVEGKAGSGKSTFMKFLYQHPKTKTLVEGRSATHPARLLFHSFWLVGTKEQHSYKGMVASLLTQLLSHEPKYVQTCAKFVQLGHRPSLYDWSTRTLEQSLLSVIDAVKQSNGINQKLCFFIDAVDELDTEANRDLFSLIKSLSKQRHCKVCVSGRPELRILKFFKGVPGLRLQDLTKNDIENYVSSELKRDLASPFASEDRNRSVSRPSYPDNTSTEKTRARDQTIAKIASTMCEKAEGVFIWVYYVLTNVCFGLNAEEDLDILLKRIRELPPKLEELYQLMWQKYNAEHKVHADESRILFSYGPYFPMHLFQIAVATNPSACEYYYSSVVQKGEESVQEICDDFERTLRSRCAGLVEVQRWSAKQNKMWQDEMRQKEKVCNTYDCFSHGGPVVSKLSIPRAQQNDLSNPGEWRKYKVQYIHRSVHDFLTTTEEGQRILGSPSTDKAVSRASKLIISSMACFVENLVGVSYHTVAGAVCGDALSCIEATDVSLIDYVEKTCRQLVTDDSDVSSSSRHTWFHELLRRSAGLDLGEYIPLDYPTAICQFTKSPDALEDLLIRRGHDWSPYYKGHLLNYLCNEHAQFLTFGCGRQYQFCNQRPWLLGWILELLVFTEADMTTPQTVAFRPSRTNLMLIDARPPVLTLLSLVVGKLLNGEVINLQPWRKLLNRMKEYQLTSRKAYLSASSEVKKFQRWYPHPKLHAPSDHNIAFVMISLDVGVMLNILDKAFAEGDEMLPLEQPGSIYQSPLQKASEIFRTGFLRMQKEVFILGPRTRYRFLAPADVGASNRLINEYVTASSSDGINSPQLNLDRLLQLPTNKEEGSLEGFAVQNPLIKTIRPRPIDPEKHVTPHEWRRHCTVREYFAALEDFGVHEEFPGESIPALPAKHNTSVKPSKYLSSATSSVNTITDPPTPRPGSAAKQSLKTKFASLVRRDRLRYSDYEGRLPLLQPHEYSGYESL